MKKLFRTIAVAALAAVCVGAVAAFAACGNNDDDAEVPTTVPEEETPSGDSTATK